jgi:two-component system, LuxR family, sensor kinase FixL
MHHAQNHTGHSRAKVLSELLENHRLATALSLPQSLLLATTSAVLVSGRIRRGRVQVRFTPALCALWGVLKPLRGGPLLNAWVHEADRESVAQALQHLAEYGGGVDIRYQARCAGVSELRWLHLVLQRDSSGNERVVGVLRDDTAAQALERDRVLTQERLQSLSRLTLLGEVASGLAHELNQPLAAITTFAQAGERLVSMPSPNLERVQQIYREVSQQALRAGDIIQRMRNLIKRHSGQRNVVSCTALIDEFLKVAEPLARASSVGLRTRMDGGDRMVDVEPEQIHQVLMILFQNALEAARDSAISPQVELSVRIVPAGIEIAITDSGQGVSDAVASQLFSPFFSTKSSGTGLGLIGCRKLLGEYGSQLLFANQPGGGCRFWFVLPASIR